MVIKGWMNDELKTISENMIEEAFDELDGIADELDRMVINGKYWDAYVHLVSTVLFMNTASQQQSSKMPGIIQRLLNWIQKIQATLSKIISGVGGKGYSIGVSAPFGVSISISF